MIVSTSLPRGGRTARFAQALAVARGLRKDAELFAESNFPDSPDVLGRIKSIDSVGLTTDSPVEPDAEFAALVAAATVLGQFGQGAVPSLRTVPFLRAIAAQLDPVLTLWAGEATNKSVSPLAFDTFRLEPRKAAAIVVLSEELVAGRGPAGEQAITQALVAGLATEMNRAFLDPASAGVPGEMPASITYGVPTFNSTGDPAGDVAGLLDATTLDVRDGVLVMSPATAAAICLRLGAGAAGLGVRGGTLAGLPVLTSIGIGANLALLHASQIACALGTIAVDSARDGSLELPESPSKLYSLWQKNARAIRIEREANWQRCNESAVQVVSDANYGTPQS